VQCGKAKDAWCECKIETTNRASIAIPSDIAKGCGEGQGGGVGMCVWCVRECCGWLWERGKKRKKKKKKEVNPCQPSILNISKGRKR